MLPQPGGLSIRQPDFAGHLEMDDFAAGVAEGHQNEQNVEGDCWNSENRKTVSPLYMEFSQQLPESLVITAEFCPLRDEGFAYIEKIRQVGVEAEHLHFDDMIHAFLNLENLVKEECETVYLRIAEFLNRA